MFVNFWGKQMQQKRVVMDNLSLMDIKLTEFRDKLTPIIDEAKISGDPIILRSYQTPVAVVIPLTINFNDVKQEKIFKMIREMINVKS